MQSLNNLAALLSEQGDLPAARPLYERALAIFEKVLEPEHPTTAMSLNNFANVLQDQGDLMRPQPLYERALAIWEKTLATEHPNTNRGRYNFARLHLAKRQAVDAQPTASSMRISTTLASVARSIWPRGTGRVGMTFGEFLPNAPVVASDSRVTMMWSAKKGSSTGECLSTSLAKARTACPRHRSSNANSLW
jgi:tetratricopeptide (TPR) repeat protein